MVRFQPFSFERSKLPVFFTVNFIKEYLTIESSQNVQYTKLTQYNLQKHSITFDATICGWHVKRLVNGRAKASVYGPESIVIGHDHRLNALEPLAVEKELLLPREQVRCLVYSPLRWNAGFAASDALAQLLTAAVVVVVVESHAAGV